MVTPDRTPLRERAEADGTHWGGPKPGKPGRGAAGKTVVAGADESDDDRGKGRKPGRVRLAVVADGSPQRSPGDFLNRHVAKPAGIATDGWTGYGQFRDAGFGHRPINLSAS